MTKKEFTTEWISATTVSLRKMYAGDPHGPACFAASVSDLPRRAEKLWRKYRKTFSTWTVDQLKAKIAEFDAKGMEIA